MIRVRVDLGMDAVEVELDGGYSPDCLTDCTNRAATLAAFVMTERDKHPQAAVLIDEDDDE